MTPTNVKDKPTVSFSADPSAYYTLIMNGMFSPFVHFLLELCISVMHSR